MKELQEELQRLHTTQTEYLQLRCNTICCQAQAHQARIDVHTYSMLKPVCYRDQLNKVQAELMYTSNKCNALSQENNLLREHSIAKRSQAKAETDPLAEQVATMGYLWAHALCSASIANEEAI